MTSAEQPDILVASELHTERGFEALKLDVPKARRIGFAHCPEADGTALVAWPGYNHLELVKALSASYVDVQENQGGRADPRLVPLLACLIELLPWLKQWHNAVDPEFSLPNTSPKR